MNNLLRAFQNPNVDGQAIFNKLDSGTLKRGEAGPMVRQLQAIYANQPDAMSAIRDGLMERLMTNPRTGQTLSPQLMANAIRDALNGPAGEVYRSLLPPAVIDRLGNFQQLLDHVGQTRRTLNPSGTGHLLAPFLKKGAAVVAGDALGRGVAAATGLPGATEMGMAAGYGLGRLRDARAAERAASGMYRPPIGFLPRSAGIVGNGIPFALDAANAARLGGLLDQDSY
jgi:hypothetical protein